MLVRDLIEHFSGREIAPIEIDAVIEHMRSIGVKEEIYYWTADIDPGILQGEMAHWSYPDNNGDSHPVVDITVSKHLSIESQRLVTCKELIHILDAEAARVREADAIRHLIERIVLPPDFLELKKDGIGAINDKLAIYQAVAILFPFAMRQLLKSKVEEGLISAKDIANIISIPERFVLIVLNDAWDRFYQALLSVDF